jgi:hypothetical protein
MKTIATILVYLFGQNSVKVFLVSRINWLWNVMELVDQINFPDTYSHQLEQAKQKDSADRWLDMME